MKSKAIWKPVGKSTDDVVEDFAQKLKVKPLYARLLLNRGLDNKAAVQQFFAPHLNDLHDPLLMKGMLSAVDRITKTRDGNEKIWVYGDYDVDGTTSVALVFAFLRQFVPDIEYYIPDREKEGYGISQLSIDLAAEAHVNLIIALDCGIRSVELVQYAKQFNIDYIICDHHVPGDKVPEAIAVLDPKQEDCPYPFKELSGCGIGFKLVQALCKHWDIPQDEAYSYLDFVAVSIASDLVQMQGENRNLTLHGLKKLNDNPSPGLKMVIDKFIDKPDLDVTNVVFMIGPRINAAGRMADARAAVRLLLAENEVEAHTLALELNKYNQERKGLDSSITEEALHQISQDGTHASRKTTVVHSSQWHKGVIGIVASRIMEDYFRPTIVLTEANDILVGSARSIEAFDIHEALTKCSAHLIQYGGHKYAAGLKLYAKDLEAFQQAFEESAQYLTREDLTLVHTYEDELRLSEISDQMLKNLKRFAPHGPGNSQLIFLCRNLHDTGNARTLGADHSHLRINVQDDTYRKVFGCIAFGMGHLYEAINAGQHFDMLFSVEENHFNGNVSLQLMVKDIHLIS